MHAQQSFLNVCNTAIVGYKGDKINEVTCTRNITIITYYSFHTIGFFFRMKLTL